MAAQRDNVNQRNKMSMAEELLQIIQVNEYPAIIKGFASTDYLTKTELSSLKKMVSGKVWLDNRKFVSRQNSIVINGMYSMFGLILGKTAENIQAEACDYFLNPNNHGL